MVWFLIYVLLFHWIGDFILQTCWVADNKNKNWEALSLHVFVYSCTLWFGIFCLTCWNVNTISRFVLINFIIHLCLDNATSYLTNWALTKRKNMHLFFTVVGFDQFLHTATLLITVEYLLGKPVW